MKKLKIEFVIKETGERVIYETTLKEMKPFGYFVHIINPANNEEFAYEIGGTKIWKPKHNVICAEEVELMSLKTEFEFV